MRAEGKKTSQGMPSAVCYPQALTMEPIKVLKINYFSSWHQQPGEKRGLGVLLRDSTSYAARPGRTGRRATPGRQLGGRCERRGGTADYTAARLMVRASDIRVINSTRLILRGLSEPGPR